MTLEVRVVPRSSRNLVKEESGCLKVCLTRPAQDGEANAQLIELLAEYLKVKKYRIRITRGEKSRNKLISVDA